MTKEAGNSKTLKILADNVKYQRTKKGISQATLAQSKPVITSILKMINL